MNDSFRGLKNEIYRHIEVRYQRSSKTIADYPVALKRGTYKALGKEIINRRIPLYRSQNIRT